MGSSVILPAAGQPKKGADPAFKTGAVPNIVSFSFTEIDPPGALYIQRDDVLVVSGTSQISNEVATISGRLLLPFAQAAGQPDAPPAVGVSGGPIVGPGYIQPFQVNANIPTSLNAGSVLIAQTEGYLLSLSVTCLQALRRGDTFVRVYLNRGPLQFFQPNAFALLLADYVTKTAPIGWPGGRIASPTDGMGRDSFYSIANPAAGADFSITLAVPGRSKVQNLKATLTTSATAGNRFPSFILNENNGVISNSYTVQDPTAVPASTTITYSLSTGVNVIRGGGAPIFATLPLPSDWRLTFQPTISSSTQGLLAGDQWSTIRANVEEWLDAF